MINPFAYVIAEIWSSGTLVMILHTYSSLVQKFNLVLCDYNLEKQNTKKL